MVNYNVKYLLWVQYDDMSWGRTDKNRCRKVFATGLIARAVSTTPLVSPPDFSGMHSVGTEKSIYLLVLTYGGLFTIGTGSESSSFHDRYR
jgi:hypothetical protein